MVAGGGLEKEAGGSCEKVDLFQRGGESPRLRDSPRTGRGDSCKTTLLCANVALNASCAENASSEVGCMEVKS